MKITGKALVIAVVFPAVMTVLLPSISAWMDLAWGRAAFGWQAFYLMQVLLALVSVASILCVVILTRGEQFRKNRWICLLSLCVGITVAVILAFNAVSLPFIASLVAPTVPGASGYISKLLIASYMLLIVHILALQWKGTGKNPETASDGERSQQSGTASRIGDAGLDR